MHFIDLGRRVRRARLDLNLSQSELARLLKVSPPSISQIERGQIALPIGAMSKISHHLHISIDELIELKLKGLRRRIKATLDRPRRSK